MKIMPKFNIGDLVFYRPSVNNIYADGTKKLGVILDIYHDRSPLYVNFPEKQYFEYEYKVTWINTGHTSVLLGFNLEKLKISS